MISLRNGAINKKKQEEKPISCG